MANVYEKTANARKDFLHKPSINLIKNHDVISIEGLNVKGMVKNKNLAKAISDSSWSSFITMPKGFCDSPCLEPKTGEPLVALYLPRREALELECGIG